MEAPVRIEVDRGVLGVVWEDGTTNTITAQELRAACPCAGCRETSTAPAEATIETAHVVGDYALGVVFGPDGHATGIFTYDLLGGLGTTT
jgi:ATP-binding protein involved in chromosome partitioning